MAKQKIYLLSALIALSGCSAHLLSSHAPIAVYNPSGQGDLAYVFGIDRPAFEFEIYETGIANVFDSKGARVIEKHWNFTDYHQVNLQPGTYKFMAMCLKGNRRGHPRFHAKVEAGKYYEVYCTSVEGKTIFGTAKDAFVAANIREIEMSKLVKESGRLFNKYQVTE